MARIRLDGTLAAFVLLAPVAAGLAATILPAFGYAPMLGIDEPGLWPWRRLFAEPGLLRGALVGTVAGVLSSLLALLLCHATVGALWGTRAHRRLERALVPLLAMPHAAFAVGFAFLIAPSGLLLRLLSPWATGLVRPPDWLLVNDPLGLALLFALALRETPFLLFAALAALPRLPVEESLAVARTLGHGHARAWLFAVLPQLHRAIRLPVLAVLAYGVSVVDMALVVGPAAPPTLAVQVTRLALDPALELRAVAAAGALFQLLLVLLAFASLLAVERALAGLSRLRAGSVAAMAVAPLLPAAGRGAAILVCGSGLAVVVVLALWSVAGPWRFPAAVPDALTLRHWQAAGELRQPIVTTVLLAFGVSLVALATAVPFARGRDRARPAARLSYLPLLVPQLAFVPGLQFVFLAVGLDGTPVAVAAAHFVYVFPYVLLMLAGPWRALSPRYGEAARSLGHGAFAVFARVELPLLLRPILAAFAVGWSVSIAQYLPTLLIGGGRVSTLTTRTVALAASGDRRLAAVAGLVLALLPLAGFALPLLACGPRRGAAAAVGTPGETVAAGGARD